MITKIKWHKDPVLGDLELDLIKNGRPCNTIVLAGENGTGKTRILKTLATFLNRQSFAPFEHIECILGGEKYILTRMTDSDVERGFHHRTRERDNHTNLITSNININKEEIENDAEDIRHYGVAYSKARSGFSTKQIKSSTTQELDNDSYQLDDNEDFTPLKQLIIDLSEEDNQEWMERTKESQSHHKLLDDVYEIFERQSKLTRFKNAFNTFFDSMNFSDVKTMNGEKNVYFAKHSETITIDQLSTGEKQIVFRGAYLLRNKNQLSGGTILVDEPELSMHPKWQEKILKYYRDLFAEGGEQKVQMFFATHSENVIKAALEDRENVLVVVLKDEGGQITAKPITTPSVLPTIMSAEINYQAFEVASTDYHNALYGYIEAEGWKSEYDSLCTKTSYIRLYSDGHTTNLDISLSEKLRHIIHHPENPYNGNIEEMGADIKVSIEKMRNFIIGKK